MESPKFIQSEDMGGTESWPQEQAGLCVWPPRAACRRSRVAHTWLQGLGGCRNARGRRMLTAPQSPA